MGARSFSNIVDGATAQAAFDEARRQARIEHGTRRNGTIAEKDCFDHVDVPAGIAGDERAMLRHAFDILPDMPGIDDKYGPAGCMRVAPGRWLFFGMAPD